MFLDAMYASQLRAIASGEVVSNLVFSPFLARRCWLVNWNALTHSMYAVS